MSIAPTSPLGPRRVLPLLPQQASPVRGAQEEAGIDARVSNVGTHFENSLSLGDSVGPSTLAPIVALGSTAGVGAPVETSYAAPVQSSGTGGAMVTELARLASSRISGAATTDGPSADTTPAMVLRAYARQGA